jgi:hypothetical protein
MEQGLIFTEDKKDIEVFFLKPQQPKPLIDDSIAADNKDCYDDDLHLMTDILQETDFLPPMEGNPHNLPWAAFNEQDVNENSAGGGAHGCYAGHKGVQGTVGVREDEADIFEAISECLEKFSVTDLNVNDSSSRDILSITITRKIKNLL